MLQRSTGVPRVFVQTARDPKLGFRPTAFMHASFLFHSDSCRRTVIVATLGWHGDGGKLNRDSMGNLHMCDDHFPSDRDLSGPSFRYVRMISERFLGTVDCVRDYIRMITKKLSQYLLENTLL